MVALIKLPGYDSGSPVDFKPVYNALADYRKGMEQQRQGEVSQQVANALRAKDIPGAVNAAVAGDDAQTGIALAGLDIRQKEAAAAEHDREVKRIAGRAQGIPYLPEAEQPAAWKSLVDTLPNAADTLQKHYGISIDDYRNGPRAIVAEALGVKDPTLEALRKAQTAKALAEAERARREPLSKFGLNPVYATDANGNVHVLQLNDRGGIAPVQTPDGLNIGQPVKTVDLGTGVQVYGGKTGTPQGVLRKDLSGAAYEKETGEAAGKAAADLPRIENNAQLALKAIDQIRNHPGKSTGFQGYFAEKTGGIPNTEQRGFVNLIKQARGKAFLEAYQSLRGGGAITEIEGAKATDALVRMDAAQTEKDFDTAMSDFEDVVKRGLAVAHERAKRPATAGATAPNATVTPQDALAQAREAIKAGKDPEAVKGRLRSMGIDPSGL